MKITHSQSNCCRINNGVNLRNLREINFTKFAKNQELIQQIASFLAMTNKILC